MITMIDRRTFNAHKGPGGKGWDNVQPRNNLTPESFKSNQIPSHVRLPPPSDPITINAIEDDPHTSFHRWHPRLSGAHSHLPNPFPATNSPSLTLRITEPPPLLPTA